MIGEEFNREKREENESAVLKWKLLGVSRTVPLQKEDLQLAVSGLPLDVVFKLVQTFQTCSMYGKVVAANAWS